MSFGTSLIEYAFDAPSTDACRDRPSPGCSCLCMEYSGATVQQVREHTVANPQKVCGPVALPRALRSGVERQFMQSTSSQQPLVTMMSSRFLELEKHKPTQPGRRHMAEGDVVGEADLIILGATPAGISASIAAARLGKTSLILERTPYVGGLPANGLGATDISTRGATGGLFLEFVARIKQHYISAYGQDSVQVRDCSHGYHFEPSVADVVITKWLREYSSIRVLTQRQFDFEPQNLRWKSQCLASIAVMNLRSRQREIYGGKFFLHATYEGDLIDAAGVPYLVGREGQDVYGEIGAGCTYKLWYGPECDGTTHRGDNAIQAYNYRLCLTADPTIMAKVNRPEDYNRLEYSKLVDGVVTGRHGGVNASQITHEDVQRNIERSKLNLPPVPNKLPGISRLFSNVSLPNGKVDANNQHFAHISTDLPEENWPYPTSSWAWRDKFAKRQRSYTEGLLYFAQNDEDLPQWFRDKCMEWGWAKDEYQDNGHFPRQIYVREGRRMKGKYIFTANDVEVLDQYPRVTHDDEIPLNGNGHGSPSNNDPETRDIRHSISISVRHIDTITTSHYALDSHGVRKHEPGRAHLDGFVGYYTHPYTVPYRIMVPDAPVRNLLAPVPVSASHMGFSTLRMEPCWMALGQAAGVAASLCIDHDVAAGDVDVEMLQRRLLDEGAVLVYHEALWWEGVTMQERAEMQWRWLRRARDEAGNGDRRGAVRKDC